MSAPQLEKRRERPRHQPARDIMETAASDVEISKDYWVIYDLDFLGPKLSHHTIST
jgi:hypothetical protein